MAKKKKTIDTDEILEQTEDERLLEMIEKSVLMDLCSYITKHEYEEQSGKLMYKIGEFARKRFYKKDE